MRINVLQSITDYEGKEIKVPKLDDDGTPVKDDKGELVMEPEVLRKYLITALNAQANDEPTLTAEQKARVYYLSNKIYASKTPDFTAEDIVFIKERVGKVYPPLTYGRICDILESKTNEIEPEEKGDPVASAPKAPAADQRLGDINHPTVGSQTA